MHLKYRFQFRSWENTAWALRNSWFTLFLFKEHSILPLSQQPVMLEPWNLYRWIQLKNTLLLIYNSSIFAQGMQDSQPYAPHTNNRYWLFLAGHTPWSCGICSCDIPAAEIISHMAPNDIAHGAEWYYTRHWMILHMAHNDNTCGT